MSKIQDTKEPWSGKTYGEIEEFVKEELDNKAGKAKNFKDGNLAALDSEGNPADSGYSPDNFLTDHQPLKTINGIPIAGEGNIEIPRGKDGADAVNPFKGWFGTVEDLQQQHPEPSPGDYAYVKGVNAADPAKIYVELNGGWEYSGHDMDSSNVQTFKSGEQLNEIGLDNTHLDNPQNGSVAKAEDVKPIKDTLKEVYDNVNGLNGAKSVCLNSMTPYMTNQDMDVASLRISANTNKWATGTSTANWIAVKVTPGAVIRYVNNGENAGLLALVNIIPKDAVKGNAPAYNGGAYQSEGKTIDYRKPFYVVDKETGDNLFENNQFTLPQLKEGANEMYLYITTENSNGVTDVVYYEESDVQIVGLKEKVEEINSVKNRTSLLENKFDHYGYNQYPLKKGLLPEEYYIMKSGGKSGNIGKLCITSVNTWQERGSNASWELVKVEPGSTIYYEFGQNNKSSYLALLASVPDKDTKYLDPIDFYGGTYTKNGKTINFGSRFRIDEEIDGEYVNKFSDNQFVLPNDPNKPDMYLYIVTNTKSFEPDTTYYAEYYGKITGLDGQCERLSSKVELLERKSKNIYGYEDSYFGSRSAELEAVSAAGNTLKPLEYNLYALADIPVAIDHVPDSGPAGLFLFEKNIYAWDGTTATILDNLNVTAKMPTNVDPVGLYLSNGNVYVWDGSAAKAIDNVVVSYHETAPSVQHRNLQEKAKAYSYVRWYPKNDIPVRLLSESSTASGHHLFKDAQQYGLPYTSNKEISKYVGLTVTMYTFMTAANNPFSLLYTENVNKEANDETQAHPHGQLFPGSQSNKPASAWGIKYHGAFNTATYFGCVCSEFTALCTGRQIDYATGQHRWLFEHAHKMSRLYNPTEEYVQIGDVILNIRNGKDAGHVRLVVDIERNPLTQKTTKVRIAEATSYRTQSTHSEEYPYAGNVSDVEVYRPIDLYKNNDDDLTCSSDYGKFIDVSKIDRFLDFTYESVTSETDNGKHYGRNGNRYINRAQKEYTYNNDICTFAGDKASFATKETDSGYEGDLVVLNYNLDGRADFYEDYRRIVVENTTTGVIKHYDFPENFYENNNFHNNLPSDFPRGWRNEMENHFLYLGTDLEPGKYRAWVDGEKNSESTYWEIIDTTYSAAQDSEDPDMWSVDWDNQTNKAIYVRIVDESGHAFCGRELTESEKNDRRLFSNFKRLSEEQKGDWLESLDVGEKAYIKLFFQGDYGQVFGKEEFYCK